MNKLFHAIIAVLSTISVTIISTTINMANADSPIFSSVVPSPIQSRPVQPPHRQDQYGLKMAAATSSDKMGQTDLRFPLSSLVPPQSYLQRPSEQPLFPNALNNPNDKLDNNHLPSVLSQLPF
jgi:hypothetical protein